MFNSTKLVLVAFCSLFTAGCILDNFRPPHTDEFAKFTSMPGFNFLPLPRSSIPIGAIWIQHTGPNDSGVTKDNLVTDTSYAGFKITDEDNAALTVRFASFFGLSAKQVKNIRLDLDGLQITKVSDLFKLNISSGNNILYEGISAKTLKFTSTHEIGGELQSAIKAKKFLSQEVVNLLESR